MTTSMLEYLASLRKHGHTPESIGTAQIGRTVYAAGSFITPERPIASGCRAYSEGQRTTPAQRRIALIPIYRTDWVSARDTGPTPALLPASYRRHAVYRDHTGEWFISGWNGAQTVLWLDSVGTFDIDCGRDKPYPRMLVSFHWSEPFATSLALASPAVLARIEAQ